MPSLNQGKYIEEAILSVLQQDHHNFELIVIDGGSNDNTTEVLKRYSERITFWSSEKDSGQTEAINNGLRRTSGDIVTWLNSDDVYEPGTFKKVSSMFSAEVSADFLHGKALLFGERRKEKIVGLNEALSPEQYLPYMRFPQPAAFFRREILERTGALNGQLHYAMDHELVVRAVLLGAKSFATKDILARYRLHSAAKTVQEHCFFEEWTAVFANALNSLAGGDRYVRRLTQLSLYKELNTRSYPCNTVFNADQIRSAFLEHLHLHFHYYYRKLNGDKCREIYEVIRETDPARASARAYSTYLWKLKIFPSFLFKLRHSLNT